MFWPMMIGSAAEYFTAPVMHSACRIPTEAEEDWMIAVSARPASMPSTGLVNISRMLVNSGTSARGLTASLIMFMPFISTVKPTRIWPMLCFFSFLVNMMNATPHSAMMGVKELGLSRRRKTLLPSMPVSDRIQLVTVVPMFAPMITPAAWLSFMMPELTKPTTMTVVAEDDWMTAVTAAPSSTALRVLLVSFSRMVSSLPPDMRVRPSPMMCMPYRNSARPQIILSTPKISMCFSSFDSRFCTGASSGPEKRGIENSHDFYIINAL